MAFLDQRSVFPLDNAHFAKGLEIRQGDADAVAGRGDTLEGPWEPGVRVTPLPRLHAAAMWSRGLPPPLHTAGVSESPHIQAIVKTVDVDSISYMPLAMISL